MRVSVTQCFGQTTSKSDMCMIFGLICIVADVHTVCEQCFTALVLIDGGQRDTLARHSGTVGGIKIEPLFQNVLTFQPIEDSAMHTRPK